VVDPEGCDCPSGTPGQILVKGPSVTPGYWANPRATSEALVDGWLHTGDVGVLDEEGYLTYHDRLKEMIISGGLNISPVEVENVISEYPGVEEVSVISVPDAKFGETPAAIVRPAGPLAVDELIGYCNANLSDYKVPRYVVLTDDPLPRLASGKIAKQEVRRRWADLTTLYERVR
jgi:fatty-acyl-CoA synthase